MLNKIGFKIKQLRLQRGLSQKDISCDLLNRAILSHIENDKMLPNLQQLDYISNKLKVHISYFFCNDEIDISDRCNKEISDEYTRFYNHGNYEEILKLHNNCNSVAIKDHIIVIFYVGMSYFNLSIKNDAIKYLKKFLYRFSKLNHEKQREICMYYITALNTLFKLMFQDKIYDKGIKYLSLAKKSIYMFNIIDSEMSYIVHSNLAYSYYINSRFNDVINLLEFFISYNKKTIYSKIIPNIHLTLSLSYYNIGEYNFAMDHLTKSTFFYDYIGLSYMSKLNDLNKINIYRFKNNFIDAFSVLNYCKSNYSDKKEIYIRFQIQESILYFNIEDYNKCIEVLKNINYRELSISNKKDYTLMKAHIAFLNNEYKLAESLFKKCKNYYIVNNFNYDLSLIYYDLFKITSNKAYLEEIKLLKKRNLKKNILVNWIT